MYITPETAPPYIIRAIFINIIEKDIRALIYRQFIKRSKREAERLKKRLILIFGLIKAKRRLLVLYYL
jgi:hypothetical protein